MRYAGGLAATFLIAACGAFGATGGDDTPAEDGGTTTPDGGGGPAPDASDTPVADAGSPDDGCYDFRVSSGGWTEAGNVTRTSEGFVIPLSSAPAHIVQRFQLESPRNISHSHVILDWSFQAPAILFGTQDKVTVLTQYYGGTNPSSIQNTLFVASEGLRFQAMGTVGTVTADAPLALGAVSESLDRLKGLPAPPLRIDTRWAPKGSIALSSIPPSAGSPASPYGADTMSGDPSKDYFLQIGGIAAIASGITIVVHSVCVTLE